MYHPSPHRPLLFIALIFGFNGFAQAGTGVSDTAPAVEFYLGLNEECCGEDPHPVHGIQTSDGGYALVGKTVDSGGEWDGFVVKLMAAGRSGTSWVTPEEFSAGEWSKSFGASGQKDGFNNVAVSDAALFAAGFRYTGDGTVDRYLVKYDLSTGVTLWEATFADDFAGSDGAFESIMATADGGLITTGVMNAEAGALEGFKSYGNPSHGAAFIAYFTADQLASSQAPSEPSWLTMLPGSMSGKGLREVYDADGGYIVAAAPLDEEPFVRVLRVSADGEVLWSESYSDHGEVTDIAVLGSGGETSGFALVGHRGSTDGGIDGSVTKLALDGSFVWHQSVGNPVGGVGPFSGLGAGNPMLIYDECWGIRGTADGGMVVACGTGIEGCDEWQSGSDIRAECQADPRTTWRGLVVKLDGSGNELWHRVDSFVEEGEDDGVPAAASEYVSLTSDGGIISIVDQSFGIGLLVLKPQAGGSSDPEPEDDDEADGEVDDNSEDDSGADESETGAGDEEDPTDPETDQGGEGDSAAPESGCSATGSSPLSGLLFSLALWCLWAWVRPRRMCVTLPHSGDESST